MKKTEDKEVEEKAALSLWLETGTFGSALNTRDELSGVGQCNAGYCVLN